MLINDRLSTILTQYAGEMAFVQRSLISTGTYDFSGNSYLLENEGLYRFLLPGKVNAQRIVYKNDLDSLLSSIS